MGLRPPDPHRGLCPLTPAGGSAPDPHYRLALRARHILTPTFLQLPHDLDLDLGSGHTAYRRALLIDLYLHYKFH